MNEASVLKNLSDYNCWEFERYKLGKDEADVIIPLLEKAIPAKATVEEYHGLNEDSLPFFMAIGCCPMCGKEIKFSVPNYCDECGQKLVPGIIPPSTTDGDTPTTSVEGVNSRWK